MKITTEQISENQTYSNQSRRGSERLESALSEAVKETQAYARDLRAKVNHLLKEMGALPQPVAALRSGASGTAESLVAAFLPEIRQQTSLVADLFARQESALEHFNIVLFGRTGSGKSTLIEALTGGDGSTVSDGQSDWTKEISGRPWSKAVLMDTPGINGWGNGDTRAALEERARHAVETADLVLLCFDSQSQQESEFSKIMEWVGRFNKACVSVLNVRNSYWRRPSKVPFKSARQNIANHVAAHSNNILGELSSKSLVGVPVVALSSQRALAGLGSMPFRSPDQTLPRLRARGAEEMIAQSNVALFEDLLVQVVQDNATGLRLGALSGQLAGVLDNLDTKMQVWESQARAEAEVLERKLLGLFQFFGYPDSNSELRKPLASMPALKDPVRALEDLRTEAFQAPLNGSLLVDLKAAYADRLSAVRAEVLNQVERLVIDAFDRGRKVSDTELRKAADREEAIQAIWKSVCQTARSRIQKRVGALQEEAAWDFTYLSEIFSEIDGQISESMARFGSKLRGAGVLIGAIGAVLSFVTGGMSALVTGLVSGVLSWFGRKKEQEAAAERLRKRREAIADTQAKVHREYDGVVESMDAGVAEIIDKSRLDLSLASLRAATLLRLLSSHFGTVRAQIANLRAALPSQRSPQEFVQEAVRKVESRVPSVRSPWLGESWIDDPRGLESEDGPPQTDGRNTTTKLWPEMTRALREWIERRNRTPKAGAGRIWLDRVKERLETHAVATGLLEGLEQIKAAGKPQIVFCGDYNSGKSSLIRPLLLEAGADLADSPRVNAMPTTAEAAEYDWNGLQLVDVPGFQSSSARHTRNALHRYSEAALIVYSFQPNLVTGETKELDHILKGSSDEFGVAKINRTLCVINRVDELGSDPELDPEGFQLRCRRKISELQLALRSRGLSVESGEIQCVASDPYGMAGSRDDLDASQFDNFRRWDGIDELASAFLDRRRHLQAVGVDISILEAGLVRLGDLHQELRKQVNEEESKVRILQESLNSIEAILEELASIEANAQTDLDLVLTRFAGELRQSAFAAQSKAEFAEIVNEMGQPDDPKLITDLNRWFSALERQLEDWTARTASTLDRRFRSQSLRNAFDVSANIPEAPEGFDSGQRKAASAFDSLGSAAKLFGNRDLVYTLGKLLGVKFRPWGAVHAAKNLQAFGGYLGAGAVVLDIWACFADARRASELEQHRRSFAEKVIDWKNGMLQQIISGAQDSPKAAIEALRKNVFDSQRPLREAAEKHREAAHSALEVQAKLRELSGSARRALTEAA